MQIKRGKIFSMKKINIKLQSGENMYTKKIYFSGGDYHELQEVFSDVPGVMSTAVGYIETVDDINSDGVEIVFNPKKMDLSMLMDILFAVVDPYTQKTGVYYVSGEDEPQVELHLNFIANRGKQPAVSCVGLTLNDPNSNPKFARKCLARASRLKKFTAADEEQQHYLRKHPEISTDIDLKKLKTYLRF